MVKGGDVKDVMQFEYRPFNLALHGKAKRNSEGNNHTNDGK